MTGEANQYNQTFRDICNAARAPEKKVLVTHIWESKKGKDDAQKRAEEIRSMLAAMSGGQSAVYHDLNYLDPDRPADEAFATRYQVSGAHGLKGLATSPLSEKAGLPLYTWNSNTGLILLDPDPVAVSPYDTASVYYEDKSRIPGAKAWDAMKALFLGGQEGEMPGIDLFRDPPEKAAGLLHRLTLFKLIPGHVMDAILRMQGIDVARQPYAQIDPADPSTIKMARTAFGEMMRQFNSGEHKLLGKDGANEALAYMNPEVNVNARLEHAAGIVVVNNEGPEITVSQTPKKIVEAAAKAAYSPLAADLARAVGEHKILQAVLKEKGIDRKPTIVLYQPHAKDKLIHLPPNQLRALVDKHLRTNTVNQPPFS